PEAGDRGRARAEARGHRSRGRAPALRALRGAASRRRPGQVHVLRDRAVSAPAAARWAAFLRQIDERHAALLDEAECAAPEALPHGAYDPVPIATAWSAVTHRLKDLERRGLDTWHEKVAVTFDAEGYSPSVQQAERRRGEDLAFVLENRRELREA